MEIEQSVWGCTPDNESVAVLYTMRNKNGATVKLCNIGAGIVSICVPDRNGKIEDVILGYKNPLSYLNDGPYLGKVPGRFANRIAKGLFTLEGKEYKLAVNNGANHLHGGPTGFANRFWEGRVEGNRVIFALNSPDGDEGYPADLYVEAVYDWNDDNELELTLLAKSNGTTIINLTNHAYFNLAGENSGTVLNQKLKLNASKWLPTDSGLIPTGEIADVKGTPMDFTVAKQLGKDIRADFPALNYGKGYDNCWVVDSWQSGKVGKVAELTDDNSGRMLEVFSDQPAVQIYTGNWLAGSPESKSGRGYNDNEGVAIECQNYPDSPNQPSFPSPVLKAGEMFSRKIIFRFSVK